MKIYKFDGMVGHSYQVELTADLILPAYKEALDFTGDYFNGEDEDLDYYPEYSEECDKIILETIQGFLDHADKEELKQCDTVEKLGHNLYFSSVGHGAGFFDYNLNKLQETASSFNLDFYIDDEGMIQCQ